MTFAWSMVTYKIFYCLGMVAISKNHPPRHNISDRKSKMRERGKEKTGIQDIFNSVLSWRYHLKHNRTRSRWIVVTMQCWVCSVMQKTGSFTVRYFGQLIFPFTPSFTINQIMKVVDCDDDFRLDHNTHVKIFIVQVFIVNYCNIYHAFKKRIQPPVNVGCKSAEGQGFAQGPNHSSLAMLGIDHMTCYTVLKALITEPPQLL